MTPATATNRRRSRGRSNLRLIGAIMLGLAVILTALYVSLTAQNGLPLQHFRILVVDLSSAGDLQTYDDVRIAGDRVGQVLTIHLEHGEAVAKLQVGANAPPLRQGTTALLRLSGIVGAEYIQLTPSSSGAILRNGATIGLQDTGVTPDLFDVLDAFDQHRRTDLREIIRGLGEGLLSRAQGLNRATADSPALLHNADGLLGALNAEPQAIRNLFPDSDALAAAVEPARRDVADGFAPESRMVEPLVRDRPDVQAAFDRLPPALSAMQADLPAIDQMLDASERLSQATTRLSASAPSGLRALTALLRAAPTPLRATNRLLKGTGQVVDPVLRLTNRLAPLSAPLTRLLAGFDPLWNTISSRDCDLTDLATWLRSAAGYGTPPGTSLGPQNVVRVLLGAVESLPEGAAPPASDAAPAPCMAPG